LQTRFRDQWVYIHEDCASDRPLQTRTLNDYNKDQCFLILQWTEEQIFSRYSEDRIKCYTDQYSESDISQRITDSLDYLHDFGADILGQYPEMEEELQE
jgi:hypothetical protein